MLLSEGYIEEPRTATVDITDDDVAIVSMNQTFIIANEGDDYISVCVRLDGPTGGTEKAFHFTLSSPIANHAVVTYIRHRSMIGYLWCARIILSFENSVFETSPRYAETVILMSNDQRVNTFGYTDVYLIDDDDPTVRLDNSSYTLNEGPFQDDVAICVVLEGPSGGLAPGESFTVTFIVVHDTATSADYLVTSSLTVVFNSSDVVGAIKCVTVRAIDDDIVDPDEKFIVTASSTNPRVNFTRNLSTVVIIDSDPIIIPGPPRNLVVVSKTSQSVILSWESPNLSSVDESITVTGYIVEWSNSQTSTFAINPIIQITGLAPYQLYQISVKVVYTRNNYTGHGEKASIEETTLEEAPDTPPTSLRAVSSMATTLTLSWGQPDGPNGIISAYTLYVDYQNGSMNATYTTLSPPFTVPNLWPYQNLSVQVSANTSVGEGPRSSSVVFTTAESVPGPVAELTITRVSNTVFTIQWEKPSTPNGVIQHYIVNITAEDLQTKYNTTATHLPINQLVPYTPYVVSVAAINGAGRGETVSKVEFTAEGVPSSHPLNVVVERTSQTSGLISWTLLTLTVARGFVTSYRVEYWTVGSDGLDVMSVLVPGDQNLTILTGLKDKGYYITVSASTVIGQGEASVPILLPLLENSLNVVIIIGAAVGSLVMVIIIFIFLCSVFLLHRNKQQKKTLACSPSHKINSDKYQEPVYEEIDLPGYLTMERFSAQKCGAYEMVQVDTTMAVTQN